MSSLRSRIRPVPIGFIEPCLPAVTERPPEGSGWLHEIKHDGYRLMAWRKGSRVRLFTRNGVDWSEHFPRVVDAVAALNVRSCLIDGEAVCVRPDGIADFELLRRRLEPVRMFAFDVLSIDGDDLRDDPIEHRKATLASILRGARSGLRLNEHIEGETATRVFAHACALGAEGIVSKRKGSRYQSGRCRDWIKLQNPHSPAAYREATEDWAKERWQ